MASPQDLAGKSSVAPTMKPYLGDPQSRSRRRARRWLIAGVTLFCLFYGFAYALVTPYLLTIVAFPVAVLAIIVVWALPDTKRPPVPLMEGFFFAMAVAMVLWPNYLAIALPGLPWITVARLTQFPFALLLAVCLSTSAEFRSRTYAAMNATPITWRLLVAFVAIQAFSILMSNAKADSIQKFLIAQIDWTAVFLAACFLFLKPNRADLWAKLLWAMAIPIGLIALVEHHLRHLVWAGHIPSFLQVEDPSVQRILSPTYRAYTTDYRAQATFTTPLALAEYLALTMPFIIHYLITSKNRAIRIAAGLSVPYLLYVILISGSRLGVVGFALAVMIYGLVWSIMRWRRQRGDLISAAVVFSYPLLFAAAVAATLFIGRLHKAFWGGGSQLPSTLARITQWKMGIPKVLKNPIGYGIGRCGDALGYVDPSGIITIDTYYLLILLEYGIIGFIVYYGLISISIFYSMRWSVRAADTDPELSLVIPLGIALSAFLVIKSVYSGTDNHTLVFMMMGMICALIYRTRHSLTTDGAAPAGPAGGGAGIAPLKAGR